MDGGGELDYVHYFILFPLVNYELLERGTKFVRTGVVIGDKLGS